MGGLHGPESRKGVITVPHQNGARMRVEQRRHDVIQMKVAGATERQIAAQFDVTQGQINRDVKAVLQAWAKDNEGNANRTHALEMARYNRLLLRWWQRALDDNIEVSLKGTEQVMKILRQIDVINGIVPDEPLINVQQFIDARQQTLNETINIFADEDEFDWSSIPDADLDHVMGILDAARRDPLALSDGDGPDDPKGAG